MLWQFYSILRFWFPEKHLQLCLKDKTLVSLPPSNLVSAVSSQTQGDEFIEITLQHPVRSSENCLHFDKTTGRRDLQLCYIPPPSSSTRTITKMSSELGFHRMPLIGQGREDLEEMRDDIKSSPFPKLRSRWLLIIFHANLQLERHFLVEWSMAVTEELCLQK